MGHVLVLAEKPSAARRIADALAKGGAASKKARGANYYVLERGGRKHVVAPAAGHLYTLSQKGKGWTYPIFNIEWVESYQADKGLSYTKKYLHNIRDWADADEYIVATDYDVEGRIIAYNILRFTCGTEEAKTMRFSTLTASDLIEAYENASEGLEWGVINSGLARHSLDYYYGINLTRALTLALNKTASLGFRVISAGRVQAPALGLLLEREEEIREFKPQPYWQIELHAVYNGVKIKAQHVRGKFGDEGEAREVHEKCRGGTPRVSKVDRREYIHQPPTPFNITDLQTEVYRLHGYTPDRTHDIAQYLYTEGWISYPRTSSQKLPEGINYRRILEALKSLRDYRGLASKLLKRRGLKPREGDKTDPAHAAIYPTHQPPKGRLKGPRGRVYDLICRRFLATLAQPALREAIKVTIEVGGEKFQAVGRRTIRRNWYQFYEPYIRLEESSIPRLEEGDALDECSIQRFERRTKPPPRYTPASLLKALEERGLGTRATRSQIIRTLYDRGYLRGNRIRVTKLGETVVRILKEYCPKIVSEELTREAENRMEEIQQGRIDKEEVIKEAEQVLKEVLREFKRREEEIGEKLSASFKKSQQSDAILGECPTCGNRLKIIYSKKTHLRFVGCEGYFKNKCTFSSPLPQKGIIQAANAECKYCKYPMVEVHREGRRRPWLLCVNPQCPHKKKR